MAEKPDKSHDVGEATANQPGSDVPYQAMAVQMPTVRKVKSLAEDMKLDLTDNQLEEVTKCFAGFLEPCEKIYRMVEPKPPVKYPRSPGYRPPPEENIHNAWYVKTDIQGSPTGKLVGKKIAIKDNISVAGVPMMDGSKMLEGYIPAYDATVVTRTLDAGGHIVGKTACENLCFSGGSFTNDIGPVPNPCDPTRTSGGSSSGNAVALVTGEVDMAIGGDQGGSVRIPTWCGIVGHKPTFGLIPYTGAVPIETTLDYLGPMTRNVRDCALFLEVLAGYDGMDHRQPETFPPVPEYSQLLMSDLSGMKIGILKEGFMNCEPDVADVVKKAAKNLTKKGATVEEVSIPMHSCGKAIWSPTITEGGYETLAVRSGNGPSYRGFHDTYMMDHLTKSFRQSANAMSMPMKVICLVGKYLQETNNYHYYCRASNLTMALTKAYDEKLKDFDVLVMPTLPYKAPKLPTTDASIPELVTHAFGMVQNTAPFNSTGHPALGITAGKTDGLPISMMIVGKKWHDLDVLNVALAHEELRG